MKSKALSSISLKAAFAAAFALAAAPMALCAATVYQNVANDPSGSYGSLTNAVRWTSNGSVNGTPSRADGDLNPEHDYATANDRVVCTFAGNTAAESLSFKGKSLTVGFVRHKSYGDAIVDWDDGGKGDGLIFRNKTGNARYTNYSPFNKTGLEAHVYGKVTVDSSDTAPFPIVFNNPVIFNFHGAFWSEAGKTLNIQFDAAGTFKFSGSLENYKGTIAAAGANHGTLKFGTTTCPGKVLATNAVTLATLAADDVFTVDTLALGDGAKISVAHSADGTPTNSVVVVTNALVVAGTTTVAVDASFYETYTNTTTRIPVLTFPASSAACPDNFSMSRARFVIESNETAGTKTLYAIVTPTVIRNTAVSLKTDGSEWTDELPVHENAQYILQKVDGKASILSTPAGLEEYAFPGDMLTIDTSCTFQPNDTCADLYVKELRLNASGICMFEANAALRGRIVMPKGSYAYICVYRLKTLDLAADIVGDEWCRIVMDGRHSSTSSRGGFTRLTGDNSRFFGSITVGLNRDPQKLADNKYQRLYVSDPAKLGMPRSTFSATALVLKRLARLVAEGSVTFADVTRGIYIGEDGSGLGKEASNTGGTDSEGQFYVDADETLAILTQLTMNGRLHKYGAGTLALGGPLKFGPASSIGDTPLASSNLLAVAEGYVKPLAADAFNGMEMTFAAGTGIRLDINPEDGDLRTYGLRNTKAVTAFTPPEGAKIPVTFDVPAGFKPTQGFTVGVATAAAADIAKLTVAKPHLAHFRMSLQTQETDGVATLRAQFSPVGMMLVIY